MQPVPVCGSGFGSGFRGGAGFGGREPSTAALKPIVTPPTDVNRYHVLDRHPVGARGRAGA